MLIFGDASGKLVATLSVEETQLDLTMMEFLRQHNIPVASSCFGEGVCRKCVVKSGDIEFLTCLITVKSFLELYQPNISISYL